MNEAALRVAARRGPEVVMLRRALEAGPTLLPAQEMMTQLSGTDATAKR